MLHRLVMINIFDGYVLLALSCCLFIVPTQVLALVNSVAIRVSQQDFYLKSFNDVLLRLGELEITPKKPELRRQASWLGAIKGVGSATSEVVVGGDSQMCHGKKGNDDDDKGKQS